MAGQEGLAGSAAGGGGNLGETLPILVDLLAWGATEVEAAMMLDVEMVAEVGVRVVTAGGAVTESLSAAGAVVVATAGAAKMVQRRRMQEGAGQVEMEMTMKMLMMIMEMMAWWQEQQQRWWQTKH